MQTLTKSLGMVIAAVAVVAAVPAKASADDALLVRPAIHEVSSSSNVEPSVQLVGWRYGPAGYGYYRPYRPYRASYGPYYSGRYYAAPGYRYVYPSYGYSYAAPAPAPVYGYAYPAYSYPYYGSGVRVGVGIW